MSRHQAEGLRYVYVPTVAKEKAKRAAVRHVLDTFFNGSPEQIVAALLDVLVHRAYGRRAGPDGGANRESEKGGQVECPAGGLVCSPALP